MVSDPPHMNQVTLSPAPADYEAKLRAGDLDVVLVVDEQFGGDVAQGKQGTVRLVSDRSRDRAQASIRQAENLLRAYNRQWGAQRLLLRGVAPYVGNPLDVQDVDLATPQQSVINNLNAIAAAAISGERRSPRKGYNRPIAIGIPRVL